MKSFNLSEWALRHRTLVTYFMLIIVAAGVWSYLRLGRNEDPDFTVKTMVVQAAWPGATVGDTLEQITDRIESKLQETPSLDYLKSYTSAGQTTIFVNLKDSTPPAQVPGIWQQVREKVRDISNTLPQGVVGPGFNSDFGDTYGIVYGFTADGFTDQELRDYVVEVRKQLLQLTDVSKIDILGAQDERVYVEFSTEQLAGLGVDRAELIAALHAQNAVTPAGVVQTEDEKILVRVSGAFRSEQDVLAVNFVAQNGRIIRLGDIARVTRGPADPAQPMFRVNGRHGIGLAIAMRTGGDVLSLGRNIEQAMTEITATLPVGIEPALVADQPVTVEHAVDDFMEALWEAIAIVLAVSLVALGLRAGAVVAISIPLVLATVFAAMKFFGIDLQRISLGALIIALGLLVDDAMITIEAMVTRLERGDEKEQAGIFAYASTALPRLTGTLVTVAGFVPIGFARSAAGEYTFSIFAVVAIALIASWGVAALFAPLLGVWILKKPRVAHSEQPGPIMRTFRRFLVLAMRARWVTILLTLGLFGTALYGMRLVPQQFFPSSDRPELLVDLQLPENASIYATQEVAARVDKLLKNDQDVDHWSTYVGQGAVRFYLPLNVQLPNDFFAQSVVVTKGLQERERVKARLEQALANRVSERCRTGLSAGAGPAGRVAAAIPGERTGVGPGARDRVPGRSGDRVHPRCRERQLQLDGARAYNQDQGRPGSGSPVGSELAATGPIPERGRIRRHSHPGAQRDLSRRRADSGLRRAAHVAVDNSHAASTAAKRADRSLEPDRICRLWPGIPDRLAPKPAAHSDGAGRPRARHAGRHGRAGAGPEDRGTKCQPAEWVPYRFWRHS